MKFGLPKLALKKELSGLLVIVLIMHLADYVIIPILPVLLSIKKGLSPSQIGFIIGAGLLSFQLGSIIAGLLSNRISRKLTILTATLIEVSSLISFSLSNVYYLFLLFEILIGIGKGMYAPTIKAAIANYSSKSTDTLTTAFSLRKMAANLGVAVGGLIPLLVVNLPFSIFFFISASIYIVLFIFSLFLIPNNNIEKDCSNTSLKSYIEIFKNKSFIIFSIVSILVWAIYAQLNLLLPLRATAIFKNSKIVGTIWTITSLLVVILQTFISSRIIKKINLFTSIFFGTLIMGIGLFLIGLSFSYNVLLICASIFIIGEMLITPTIDSITSELADDKIMCVYFAVSNILYGLGTGLGSFIGGEIINYYGISNTLYPWYIFLFISAIISIMIYFLGKLPSIKNSLNKS